MIDRIFTAALAFCLLVGATLAIASAWFDSRSSVQTVRLPSVEIVANRAAPRMTVAMTENAAMTEAAAREVQ